MSEQEVKEEKKKKIKFFPAPEVQKVANEIMKHYHKHLRDAKLSFMFKDGTWKKNERVVTGDVKLISPYVHALTGIDFGIVVNFKYWQECPMETRIAIVDHLLSYCEYTEDKAGNRKWKKINPTISEFPEVVARRGVYNVDIEEISDALNAFNTKENQEN